MALWEDEVFHDPDGVDVAAIFDDVSGDDFREQYEAAAGLYWLADLRPERLQSRRDVLFDLLGNLPDYGLSGDETLGTRRWIAEAVSEYVRAYPTRIQEIIELLDSDDQRRRQDAVLALRFCVVDRPDKFVTDDAERAELLTPLADRFEQLAAHLDAEHAVIRASTLLVLAELASSRPAKASALVSRVYALLDDHRVRPFAIIFLREISLVDSSTTNEVVEHLLELLHQVGTTEPLELPSSEFRTLMVTLQTLATLAPRCPERVKSVELILRDMAKLEPKAIRKPATEALEELDRWSTE